MDILLYCKFLILEQFENFSNFYQTWTYTETKFLLLLYFFILLFSINYISRKRMHYIQLFVYIVIVYIHYCELNKSSDNQLINHCITFCETLTKIKLCYLIFISSKILTLSIRRVPIVLFYQLIRVIFV